MTIGSAGRTDMLSQHRTAATLVPANGVELEVIIEGTGEPVLLIQTALLAEEFAPLTREPALRDRYQLIRYHRRGYGGSSPVHGPGSIERDAADCRALMTALRTGPAHVVGLSYSGPIALRLAVDAADLVHSLTLLEPPPMHTPSEPQFRAACATLVEDYHLRGPADAVNTFLTDVIGPNWQTAAADTIPETPERTDPRHGHLHRNRHSRPARLDVQQPGRHVTSTSPCSTSAAATADHGSPTFAASC